MIRVLHRVLILGLVLVSGCRPTEEAIAPSHTIVTTLPVLGLIIESIASGFDTQVLLKDGQSPHGFQVSPTQAKQLSRASLLIFAHPAIDGWAADLAENERLALWSSEQDEDAHYWTDPVAVQDALKAISDALCVLEPSNCTLFRRNATAFSVRIDSVSQQIAFKLEAVRGACYLVAHPFMTQFMDRYGIKSVGPIQPLPGHDASPRTLSSMMEEATRLKCGALLVQQAVDNRSMNALAKDLGIRVVEVEPLGTNQASYESYLESLSNALLSELE
mgnify:CR=1 FL=1